MYLSIVILSYNRKTDLEKNLNYLSSRIVHSNANDIEIIIIDNKSNDGSKEILQKYREKYPFLKTIFNDKNVGVAEGRNKGYEIAKGKYILSIDDDTIIEFEDIFKLINYFKVLPKAGILSPLVRHADSVEFQNYHGDEIKIIGNFHGACRLYQRSSFRSVGLLDKECKFGGEELDYSIRHYNKNQFTYYIPEIIVKHNNYQRPNLISIDRRKKRIFNNSRLNFKYFPFKYALLFSSRYFISSLYSSFKIYKFKNINNYIVAFYSGIRIGLRNHIQLNQSTLTFYMKKDTRPDFGNKPISQKFKKKLFDK